MFPIRIGQRIVTNLNGHDFYIEIVHRNKENCHLPGYICETKTARSAKETSPTNAISSIYQLMFDNVATKFSGPQVMGWNDEISFQLLNLFVLFIFF